MKRKILVLGAGQLARMMALAGAPLNIQIQALDPTTNRIIHPLSGCDFNNNLDSAINECDVITAEFEHIPYDILSQCANSGKLQPSEKAIQTGGHRDIEKQALEAVGIASAPYWLIRNRSDFDQALNQLGLPLIFKTATDGYDGKGQWRLNPTDDIEIVWQKLNPYLLSHKHSIIIAEEKIAFQREVSVIGIRAANGATCVYPITENKHINGILSTSVVLDNSALQAAAEQLFLKLAHALSYVGVLAIELFDVDGQLLVNEIAPRVHNSGHWTINGAVVCQFENHLRAICGLPLGCTRMIRPTAMVNLLGIDYVPETIYQRPEYHVHWYGKEKRPGRKMGHINVCADTTEELSRATKACLLTLGQSD